MSPLYAHPPHEDWHGECLWVRLRLKSGEMRDGVIPNSLMLVGVDGEFRYQPKGSDLRVSIDRRDLARVEVLGVIGAKKAIARRRTANYNRLGLSYAALEARYEVACQIITEERQRKSTERLPITEEWLRSLGFKWSQIDRQPEKQWLLWIGRAILDSDGKPPAWMDSEDLGIHIGPHYRYENGQKAELPERWSCFFRSDSSGWCHRFIHLRYMLYQDEVIALIEALTGQPWRPENVLYGQLWDTARATAMREEDQRRTDRLAMLDRRCHPWTEAYKDRSRAKPLPEHVDGAIEGGKAK